MERNLKKYLKKGSFENVPEARSRTMSAIRGKHNRSTEQRLRMALMRVGIKGWKLHAQELPGNPDFYF
jgi:G:T-mismatch repair DNA endonuclease (very short patch repair protein)